MMKKILLGAGLVLWSLQAMAAGCPRMIKPSTTAVYVYLPVSAPVTCCSAVEEDNYPACIGPPFTFPATMFGGVTSCQTPGGIPQFNFADLAVTPATATVDELVDRLREAVDFALCELDVEVHVDTMPPDPTDPTDPTFGTEKKWTVVALAYDTETGGHIGRAQNVQAADTPDPLREREFARIWMQQLDNFADLDGTDSTIERWATALANFISHEVGHGFGANHAGACALVQGSATYCLTPTGGSPPFPTDPGCACWQSNGASECEDLTADPGVVEDAAETHLLAQPAGNCYTAANAPAALKHFSDTNISVTGGFVGLSAKTLSNWDFFNLNEETADAMVMTLIRAHDPTVMGTPVINLNRFYEAARGPWLVTHPAAIPRVPAAVLDPRNPDSGDLIGDGSGGLDIGQVDINGVVYDIFELQAVTPNPLWTHATADGLLPPMIEFHTGITFDEPDVMLFGVRLQKEDVAGDLQDLPLQPRYVEFGSGAIPVSSASGAGAGGGGAGFWGFEGFAFDNRFAQRPLIIRNFQLRLLPRRIDLDQMVVGGQLVSVAGQAVNPIPRKSRVPPLGERRIVVASEPVNIPVASLADERFIDTLEFECPPQLPDDCGIGPALSLFPATYVYISGTVVDQGATHWDPATSQFVTGDVETRFFRQFAGFKPDLNNNGTDDRIDIVLGGSEDLNNDGVPDEVQPAPASGRRLLLAAGVADASNFDPGLELGVGVEWLTSARQSWEAALGWRELDGQTNPDTGITSLTLARRLYAGAGAASHNGWWLSAGVGVYDIERVGTKGGLALGVGHRWALRPATGLEAALRHHEVGSGPDFTSVTLALSFDW